MFLEETLKARQENFCHYAASSEDALASEAWWFHSIGKGWKNYLGSAHCGMVQHALEVFSWQLMRAGTSRGPSHFC